MKGMPRVKRLFTLSAVNTIDLSSQGHPNFGNTGCQCPGSNEYHYRQEGKSSRKLPFEVPFEKFTHSYYPHTPQDMKAVTKITRFTTLISNSSLMWLTWDHGNSGRHRGPAQLS